MPVHFEIHSHMNQRAKSPLPLIAKSMGNQNPFHSNLPERFFYPLKNQALWKSYL